MKNYEVKYATKELADKKIVKVQQTNKRLAYLVSNMFTKMKNGFAKKVNPIIVVFQEEQASRVVEKEEVKVEEPVVAKAEPVVPTPSATDDNKKYIVKAYLADIEALSRNKKVLSQAPKKLLISELFVKKLIGNRMKNINLLNKKVEKPEDKKLSFADAQEEAVYKYISLNEEMKDLIKLVEDKKAQMISLAKEHGLTRSMVEKAMAKKAK